MLIAVYTISALLIAAIIALIAGYVRNRSLRKQLERGEIDALPTVVQPDQECCGQHEVCEKDSLLSAVSKQIEYYNDEELDRFKGLGNAVYSESEVDEFREILYTMRNDEVAGWVRSLQLRDITIPDEIKDEVFLIIGERRFEHS